MTPLEHTEQERTDDVATALLRRVRQDDIDAFRELYEMISRQLLAYCLSFTRDPDDAQDLFQHTMIRVYEYRKSFTYGRAMAWIMTIAKNAGRDWVRRRRRSPVVLAEDADTLEPADDTPETVDISDHVLKAVLDLPTEFKNVILLRYYGDMSVKDIAEVEGIGESLVKQRLFRARNRLTSELEHLLSEE